jgi:hypothetical protein
MLNWTTLGVDETITCPDKDGVLYIKDFVFYIGPVYRKLSPAKRLSKGWTRN